ncbi:phosphopantetheine-binding protein [Bacillus cereus]|uniref:phosphopantetheine-binding protein n=1 Tax=Bacillus TaxID=1386 RepID=UPI000279A9DC|nr:MULTISPECIES: phosphopantetheine-binding protein [Bacillus]EJR73548.1 hypothetical protein IK9_05083 [Bacillus cereus VD166]KIQ78524.1 hypothetical protein RW25_27735 [Bacillus sp. L_1B0_8]KIQ78637.1 hypothetical protein RT27_29365 [Bacillus sp. L_1B0_5]MDA1913557.1 phosphopantetheine-binding protein [Bacillus cereus]MDA2659677.1 phosphopantetheine-binding protein [Bacillus cereus]
MRIKERIINTLVDASEGALDRETIVQVNDDIHALSLNSLTIIRWLVNMEDEFDVEFDMEKVVLQDKLIDSFEKLTKYIQNHNQ